jgi:alginate O-acetyltransferase complex protein AlgI
MVFASPIFLFLFLPGVLLLYWVVPSRRWQNSVLLASSLLFYAWGEGGYLLVMLASIGLNYVLGLAAAQPCWRGYVVLATVTANLGLLGYYKYAAFIVETFNSVTGTLGVKASTVPEVHLPIGISFFTFQAMSYVLDVHRGKVPAQRRLGDLALYIALFPQLIAGPIVRYADVWRQIMVRHVSMNDLERGVSRFVLGLAKKVLIANAVAVPADAIFGLGPAELTTSVAWLGLICYALQIYFDFSAYSDMAIGLGRLFGFHFLENFDYPYTAHSVQDFWRRWHISLSSWLRDYLYIPLGGSRCGRIRTQVNLVLVFLLCGLWHGAAWPFVLWGAYHGLFLVMERAKWFAWLSSAPGWVGWLYTTVVWMMGWVLFRAESLTQAGQFYGALLGLQGHQVEWAAVNVATWLDSKLALMIVLGMIGAFPVIPWLRSHFQPVHLWMDLLRMGGVIVLLVLSLLALVGGSYNPFIYFRF